MVWPYIYIIRSNKCSLLQRKYTTIEICSWRIQALCHLIHVCNIALLSVDSALPMGFIFVYQFGYACWLFYLNNWLLVRFLCMCLATSKYSLVISWNSAGPRRFRCTAWKNRILGKFVKHALFVVPFIVRSHVPSTRKYAIIITFYC